MSGYVSPRLGVRFIVDAEGIGLVRNSPLQEAAPLRYTRWSYETEKWSIFAAPLGTALMTTGAPSAAERNHAQTGGVLGGGALSERRGGRGHAATP